MANPSKQKGTAAETAVVNWLREYGFPFAERRALSGANDRGDITGLFGVLLEVKNCRRLALAEWMDEAETEAENAESTIYAVVHKRPRKGNPRDWYVTMPLHVFAGLIA